MFFPVWITVVTSAVDRFFMGKNIMDVVEGRLSTKCPYQECCLESGACSLQRRF